MLSVVDAICLNNAKAAFSVELCCLTLLSMCSIPLSRCTQEMHEALQMAMTGHARILDQYAELQEKHILLLSNMREIRHGVIEYKKEAKNSGMNCVEDHWFDVQATQITYFKVEQERFKEQIRQLQSQLDDTADAVQAAGELVVRLKESERAATLAKVSGSEMLTVLVYSNGPIYVGLRTVHFCILENSSILPFR